MSTIRLLIISPVLAMRAGLRSIFEEQEGLEVVGEAQHWDEIEASKSIDVIVLSPEKRDRELEGEHLSEFETPPALLILSETAEDSILVNDLALRAWGILSPEASEEELLAAIRALHEGLLVGSPELIESQLTISGQNSLEESELLLEELTAREIEVLEALAQGRANKQIALDLDISEHTVKFHSSAIYSKMGVTNRVEAVRRGVRLGLIAF